MLNLKEITTGFATKQKTQVLHENISVEFAPGSLTLLLGANGIGKSVFLKTLLNIFPAISGSVTFNNRSINQLQPNQLADYISLMLPNPPAIDLMTSFEIAMSGQQRFQNTWKLAQNIGISTVTAYFEKCKITHLINQNFAQLSDGEKQKVMLVRCLAQETPIILLDEPMAFLDYPSRKHFLSLIKKIALEQNKIIIVSTHDIEISLPFADQILAFSKNKWQFFSQPEIFNTNLIFDEKA